MEKERIAYTLPALSFSIEKGLTDKSLPFRDAHSHKAVEIVRANRGTVTCHAGGRTVVLTPEDTLFVNSYTVHWIEKHQGESFTYIQIDISPCLRPSVSNRDSYIDEFLCGMSARPYTVLHGENEMAELFDHMTREAEEKQPYFENYIRAYIFQLTAFLCRQKLLSDGIAAAGKELAAILPAVSYIDENYKSKLYLEEISARIGCDKYRLCKLFRAATGGTVSGYINFVRLRQAENRLGEGVKNISEIALDCGFASIQYFNKVFRENRGCSPSAFRKQGL